MSSQCAILEVVSMRITLCTVFAFLVIGGLHLVRAQGDIPWTPVVDTGLVRTTITVPPQFAGLGLDPQRHVVFIPRGWTAHVYFAGSALDKPRFLDWGPDSVLYVADMDRNAVYALPDLDGDGVADEAVIAARTTAVCGDVKFYRDTMYTAAEAGVVRRWRSAGIGYNYDQSTIVVNKTQQPDQTGGNHRTRTVVLDSVHGKLYLSVGSRGNADREPTRAVIEEYAWDGSDRTVYARGVRNAVGMTLHPRTGVLWANNNGSDLQGDNIPPEWIDIVRPNGFYGYPIAYHQQNWFNFSAPGYSDLLPITASDSSDVNAMVPPAALVWAHCAPMELEWSHPGMPDRWKNGLFVVLRGSWNRSPVSGAKVVFLEFDSDQDTIANAVHEFCTGFIIDSNRVDTRWARPVGMALAADGSVYISSDDLHAFILKLTPPTPVSVDEGSVGYIDLHAVPNPADDHVTITAPVSSGTVEVIDGQGRVMLQGALQDHAATIPTSSLPTGVYHAVVRASSTVGQATFRVVR